MRIRVFSTLIRFGWHRPRDGAAVTRLFEDHNVEWNQADWWYSNRRNWIPIEWKNNIRHLKLQRKIIETFKADRWVRERAGKPAK